MAAVQTREKSELNARTAAAVWFLFPQVYTRFTTRYVRVIELKYVPGIPYCNWYYYILLWGNDFDPRRVEYSKYVRFWAISKAAKHGSRALTVDAVVCPSGGGDPNRRKRWVAADDQKSTIYEDKTSIPTSDCQQNNNVRTDSPETWVFGSIRGEWKMQLEVVVEEIFQWWYVLHEIADSTFLMDLKIRI